MRREQDQKNDARLITPLLVMALLIVCGFLYFAYTGHAPPAQG